MDINDAFHRLIVDGLSAERAWKKLAGALTDGGLKLWCNDNPNPVALDYLNANVRFIIRDGNFIAWPAGGGLGWDPHAYTFTIDTEQFERLLVRIPIGRPNKLTADMLADEIGERRRTNPVNNPKIAGGTFRGWLEHNRPLPQEKAVKIVLTILTICRPQNTGSK